MTQEFVGIPGQDPLSAELREAFARIIDPEAFKPWDGYPLGQNAAYLKAIECLALLPVPIPQAEDGWPEEWDDLLSHQGSWRSGLVVALNTAEPASHDSDDASFWQHEIDVFDRVWRALPRLIAIARAVGGKQ